MSWTKETEKACIKETTDFLRKMVKKHKLNYGAISSITAMAIADLCIEGLFGKILKEYFDEDNLYGH